MTRSRWLSGRTAIVTTPVAAVLMVVVAPADAHNGVVTINCTAVTFSYTSFPSGPNPISETISIDSTQVVAKTFTLNGSSGSDIVPISVGPGTHTVTATATWTEDGGGSATNKVTVSGCTQHCPTE